MGGVVGEGPGGAAPPGAAVDRAIKKKTDPLIGRVVNDRFRIVAPLARGGMGKVYRAEQAPLGREVALKVLHPSYSGDGDPEFHKRFFLEASTCSKLSHPNTVTIFDYGRTDDDVYFIAMELLEGRTLHRALRDDGPFDAERAMHVARQVCRSLREAHQHGVIHRDLKPANVFLMKHGDETDFVKVLDFGLVKDLEAAGEDLTQTGLFMGSPKYMSPEQIRGEDVDRRADVYSLGVILYEMLTGKVPFDRPNSVNILMAHVHDAPAPIEEVNPDAVVPPALAQIVYRALAKTPDERFSGMDEMLVALKELAVDAGLSVTHSNEIGLSGSHSAITTGRFAPAPEPPSPGPMATGPSSFPPPATQIEGGAGAGSAFDVAQAQRTPGRSSRTPLVVAAVLALALASGAAVAALLIGGDDETERTGSATVDPTTTDDPDLAPSPDVRSSTRPDAPPPAPPSTQVVLRSDPPGAMVAIGDEEHGPTPVELAWTGERAERGRSETFRFSLDGHRDYTVTRVITDDRMEVDADLEPVERAPRPRRPRPRPRPSQRRGDDEPGTPLNGYKLDPY